jgi:hypothetical protein
MRGYMEKSLEDRVQPVQTARNNGGQRNDAQVNGMMHNYQVKLDGLAQQGWLVADPGEVTELIIAHDEDCPFIVNGATCKCDPIFTVRAGDTDGCGCVPPGFVPGERSKKRNRRLHVTKQGV